MKAGVFGGSFDPVHWGHIIPLQEALYAFQLDQIIYVPAQQPPHKKNQRLSDPFHRMAMLAIALEPYPFFSIYTGELRKPPGTYTYHTLKALKEENPGEYLLIIGSDNLAILHTWGYLPQILREFKVAILERPTTPIEKALQVLPEEVKAMLEKTGNPLYFPHPIVDISASRIRKRLKQGKSIEGMTPKSVVTYIRKHGLY